MPEPLILQPSLPDSSRFGLNIVRGRAEDQATLSDPAELEQMIRVLQADIAILRAPAGSILQKMLSALPWPSWHADTLVYYGKPLKLDQQPSASTVPASWSVEIAQIEDAASIAAIARASFRNYHSHYHANPALPPALILEGYTEWAIAYLAQPATERLTFTLKDRGQSLGFLTCRIESETKRCEVVLNAVHPNASGRGVYGCLFAESLRSLAKQGIQSVEVSTQIWNYAVQRVWARQGLLLNRAYDTCHVNAMLGGNKAA